MRDNNDAWVEQPWQKGKKTKAISFVGFIHFSPPLSLLFLAHGSVTYMYIFFLSVVSCASLRPAR